MQFFPLCKIRQKAADAAITWSWHSDVVTRKNSTQVSAPWQVLNCHYEPFNPNHDGSSWEVFIDQERKLWNRRRSDTVGPGVVQISVDSWPALLVCVIFRSDMCEKDLLVTMHLAPCVLRLTAIPRCQAPSRTHTMGLLMHSCSQPSGTPLEASTAWNDEGWMWPSQLWLVANSPSVTSSGRGTEKTGDLGRFLGSPRLRAKTGCPHQNFGGCHRRLHSQSPRRTPCCSTAWYTMRRGWRATPSFSSDGIWASRGGPRLPTVSCLSTPRMHNRRRW